MQEPSVAINRSFGLDACRTCACLMVVFGHMLSHSLPHPSVFGLGFIGSFGVDLFFCLSGFLIGRILLKESACWHVERQSGLVRFWYRRWMRTLPLYFFFFVVSLQFDWKGATTLAEQYPYLFFAQNFAWPMSDFFRLSWSLAIEEWFYYLFPLTLLLFIGLGCSARSSARVTIGLFVVLPLVGRLLMPDAFPRLDDAKYIVVYRLDAIGYGVLVAYLFSFHRVCFERLASLWAVPAAMALGVMLLAKQGYPWKAASTTFTALYFTVSALVFAALIPFFYSLRPSPSRLLNRFVELTSLISYSIYLGHIFAFMVIIHLLNALGLHETIYPNPWLLYPAFLACIYALAALTYNLVEKPVLQLRNVGPARLGALARLVGLKG